MKVFTIENEMHNIVVRATSKDAEAIPNVDRFRSEAGLAKLAADWPAARLVEIWNSLPGEIPGRKFRDRTTAVGRILKTIQSLNGLEAVTLKEPEGGAAAEERISVIKEDYGAAPVATQTTDVAPKPAAAGSQRRSESVGATAHHISPKRRCDTAPASGRRDCPIEDRRRVPPLPFAGTRSVPIDADQLHSRR
jgi:hypothetical protein